MNQVANLNEVVMLEDIEQKAEYFAKKYRTQLEDLRYSPLAKFKSIGISEVYALGSQLHKFDSFKKHLMEKGSIGDLGDLPKYAYDVIVTAFGGNVINTFAGTQPIKSSHGNVYVKQLVAVNSRGNVTADQVLLDPQSAPDVYAVDFASEQISNVTVGTTTTAVGPYTSTLAKFPVRQNTVKVNVSANLYGQDDGKGKIIGYGLQGTIDYVTGAISITFSSAPVAGQSIKVTYNTNLEESGAYARLAPQMTTIPINAEVFVIGQEIGLFQGYEMQQMFGRVMEEDAITDLSDAVMREIAQKLIQKMYNKALADGAPNLTTWDASPPPNTSAYLHRMTLPFALANSDTKVSTNAGRGMIDVWLGGQGFCKYISTLEGFERSGISTSGPHIFGTYDGKIIIKAPQLPSYEAIGAYTGTGMFDKPAVFSPYMPLFTTSSLPVPNNVLKSQSVAAVYGGVDLVIGKFITRFEITNPQ